MRKKQLDSKRKIRKAKLKKFVVSRFNHRIGKLKSVIVYSVSERGALTKARHITFNQNISPNSVHFEVE